MRALFLLLSLLPAQATHAAGTLRHAVLLEERVTLEGTAAPLAPGGVEAALGEALVAKGLTVVDAEHTRALRRTIDPRAVVGGASPGPVTAQDADVVVAGLVTGAITRPLGLNVFGCSLNAQLRVVAADTGEVVLATSTQVMERDFTPEQALFAASRKLSGVLADALAARSASSAERRIELYVSTEQPVDVRVIEQLLRAVEGVEGVVSARVTSTAKDELRLEIRARGADTRALALRISDQPASGLAVWGYSDRLLRARLELSKALSLRLVPIELQPLGKGPDLARSGQLLSRALAASLAADGVFEVDAGASLAGHAEKAHLLQTLRKQPGEVVLLTGSVSGNAQQKTVSASLIRARDGKSVADGSTECPAGKLTECMQTLAGRLSAAAASALQSRAGATASTRPGVVLGASFADVYPAPFVSRARSAGRAEWVELRNTGAEAIDDLEVSLSIPGLTASPLPSERRRVLPNEAVKVPVKIILDPAKLSGHDRDETTVLQIHLAYRVGELEVRDTARRAVTVYNRSAMTWADPSSVAAFVAATSDDVQRLARAVVQSMPEDKRAEPLALAVALFAPLRGIAYVADPVNPFAAGTVDYLQFPAQTLARGAGDCDDLAVLYAALLEAVGLPALLVTVPGHILVGVPTGSPASALDAGVQAPTRALLQHEGRLYVPLDSSLTSTTFDAAWTQGARQVAAAARARKLGTIDVRRAWIATPPADLSPPAEGSPAFSPIDRAALDDATERGSRRLRQELERALSDAEARLSKRPADPELLNKKGVALVSLGRLSEAQDVFTRSVALGAASPGASNNLGNLSLMRGESAQALHWYDEAAQIQAPSDATRRYIALNRLLAAWMVDAGGPRFLELVLGASDADLKAFYQDVNGGPLGEPRAEGAPVPVAKLVRWL